MSYPSSEHLTDFYVSGGSVKIQDYWNPSVFKHDPGTFYNFEEDNLPLFDLEERTHHLWERAGFSTSGLQNTGVVLVVSATQPGIPPNNQNVFTSLQDAIDAVPEVINYPIQIEVVKYGNLGNIKLPSWQFGPSGAIEIVNRCFGKANINPSVSGCMVTSSTATGYLPNSEKSITVVSGVDIFQQVSSASAISLSRNIFASSTWNASNRAFIGGPEYIHADTQNHHNMTIAVDSTLFNDNVNRLAFTPYGIANDFTVSTTDPVIYDRLNSNAVIARSTNPVEWTAGNTGPHLLVGLVYGNYLTGLTIDNLVGPVFIRRFCIDGGTGTGATLSHNTKYGINVTNSDLVLEDMAAMRCSEAGIRVVNSNVVLSRGIVSVRNYKFLTSNTRNNVSKGVGLIAEHSTLTFSGADTATNTKRGVGVDSWFAFAYNDIGMKLFSTTVLGGLERNRSQLKDNSLVLNPVDTSSFELDEASVNKSLFYLQCFKNSEVGLEASLSLLDTKLRLCAFHNKNGIRLKSGLARIRELTCEFNQEIGLELVDNPVIYNPDYVPSHTVLGEDPLNAQFQFKQNGVHLVADCSRITPEDYKVSSNYFGSYTFSGMPDMFGQWFFSSNMGVTTLPTGYKISTPGIQLENSYVDLIHPRIIVSDLETDGGVYGAAASVKNNSTLKLNGSSRYTTMILGPTTASVKTAGLFVNNNSNLSIHGPTIIGNFGVDILGDNKSTVSFSPHTDIDNSIYDASSWNLNTNSNNHTKVELHSNRACIVLDNDSKVQFKDCGNYHNFWSGATIYSSLVVSSGDAIADYDPLNRLGLSQMAASGYIQFYPNPVQGNTSFVLPSVSQIPHNTSVNTRSLVSTNAPYGTEAEHKVYSYGGMCVRALHGSEVEIKNVHFPTGWENPSSIIYDASEPCSRHYIFNIADGSKLTATYTTVSGVFPASANYHGPRAAYINSLGQAFSGAPSSTPGTKQLSVLDAFGFEVTGLGAAIALVNNRYGKTAFDNRGPFRIYFSPNGPAKWLKYKNTGFHGEVYQTIAQNYNPSGDVSASIASNWSGTGEVYNELFTYLKDFGVSSTTNTLSDASAFFYTSAMLDPGYRNRIVLDDAGINTFANAKNSVVGGSGRQKLITYIRSIIKPQGEGFDSEGTAHGMGFLSASKFDLDGNN